MPPPSIPCDRVRELFAAGRSDAEIAAAVGCTPSGVSSCRRRLKLARPMTPRRPWTAKEVRTLRDLFDRGLTQARIVAEMRRTPASVANALLRFKITAGVGKGRFSPAAQLSRAWTLLSAGVPAIQVAKLLGIHRTTAFRYKRSLPKDWATGHKNSED